jgi:hypothetical protein
VDRRQFLKVGMAGTAVLTAAGVWAGVHSADADEEDAMLAAVAAAILDGMLPDDPPARARALGDAVAGVRQAVAGLSAAAQGEVGELFALLSSSPGRIFLARLWPHWREAPVEQVAAFLDRWRHSRFDLMRAAYAALHDLVLSGWYGDARRWEAIGYPGPPRIN